jgi:hypothetical protein
MLQCYKLFIVAANAAENKQRRQSHTLSGKQTTPS